MAAEQDATRPVAACGDEQMEMVAGSSMYVRTGSVFSMLVL